MKAETQYAYAVNIIRTIVKQFDGMFDNFVEDWIVEPSKFFSLHLDVVEPMEALKNAFEILQDAREQMDKKASPNVSISALKSIIKNSYVYNRDPAFQGMFKSNGMYCVCDGYRLVCLNDDIQSLPHVENTFDVEKAMENIAKDRIVLNLPSISEVKATIARSNKRQIPSMIIDGLVGVNAKYLLSVMQSLPECVAYVPNSKSEPILFESKAGKGLLCPVRVADKNADEVDKNWKKLKRRVS